MSLRLCKQVLSRDPEGHKTLCLDMVTINYYPTATDGDGLAKMANATLGNFKVAEATVLVGSMGSFGLDRKFGP